MIKGTSIKRILNSRKDTKSLFWMRNSHAMINVLKYNTHLCKDHHKTFFYLRERCCSSCGWTRTPARTDVKVLRHRHCHTTMLQHCILRWDKKINKGSCERLNVNCYDKNFNQYLFSLLVVAKWQLAVVRVLLERQNELGSKKSVPTYKFSAKRVPPCYFYDNYTPIYRKHKT